MLFISIKDMNTHVELSQFYQKDFFLSWAIKLGKIKFYVYSMTIPGIPLIWDRFAIAPNVSYILKKPSYIREE